MKTSSLLRFLMLSAIVAVSTADYTVVVDAGSSHTSFYLFNGSSATQEIQQLNECYIDGGLDELAYDLEAIPSYLSECVTQLNGMLDQETIRSTPLYMAGTAGLRLLQEQDPLAAENLLNRMREIFGAMDFVFQPENVLIMTGSQEGVYSLISINIIANPEESLGYGVLEMGGASVQIAYKCDPDDVSSDCVDYNVLGTNQKLFSQSNLCYGSEEAIKRYVVLQILNGFLDKGEISNEIINPCITDSEGRTPRWFTKFPTRKSEIFDSTCVELNSDWVDFEEALSYLPDDFEFVHVGNYSDLDGCADEIAILLEYEECTSVFENKEDCFKFEKKRPEDKEMFAVSAYYWNFVKILGIEEEIIDITAASDQMRQICESVQEKNLNCFDLVYVLQVLGRGYGYEPQDFSKIRFVQNISGVDVSWSLGFAATKM